MKKLLLTLILVTVFNSLATAETRLALPSLRSGQYVYVIPENFDPPLIGPSGVDELNQTAQNLNFPFFIVLVEELPGNGDGDEMAANAIDNLAQDLAERYKEFDMSKSQIFLLSYNPRKYRFLAGAKFKAELGFEKEAHKPYNSIFEKYAKGTPKDPKSGIIAMMKAVDEYLFDQTDPVRVSIRKEAARKAEEELKLQTAASLLDKEILRLTELLAENKSYLPNNIDGYLTLSQKAQSVRIGYNTQEMLKITGVIKPDIDVLENFVKARRHEALLQTLKTCFKWFLNISIVGLILFFMLRRGKKYEIIKEEFTKTESEWRSKIQNASTKYIDFYGERAGVATLVSSNKEGGLIGKTKELYDQVTDEIDAIYVAVSAMSAHIDKCSDLAKKGGYLNFSPIIKAIDALDSDFEFDTGELNKNDLFGKETKHIRIVPTQLVEELKRRFETNISGWENLKVAANLRFKEAQEVFTAEKLNELSELVRQHGIQEKWLASHPLFGNDASDQELYDRLNHLRETDLVAYLKELESCFEKQTETEKNIKLIVNAISTSKFKRINSEPLVENMTLDPDDDPRITFNQARLEEGKLIGLIASVDIVKPIEDKADEILKLYEKCLMQDAITKKAADESKKSINKALEVEDAANKKLKDAELRFSEAKRVHAKVDADKYIFTGQTYLDNAKRDLEKAKRQQKESRFLNVARTADKATDQFQKARQQFEEATSHCYALDQKRLEYEKKLQELKALKEQYEKKLHKWGSSKRLDNFNPPSTNGVVDYVILLSLIYSIENHWHQTERNAYSAYEKAESARRAKAKRQRSYSSSADYSSSSGSSWGGGSSSSSGGSW